MRARGRSKRRKNTPEQLLHMTLSNERASDAYVARETQFGIGEVREWKPNERATDAYVARETHFEITEVREWKPNEGASDATIINSLRVRE